LTRVIAVRIALGLALTHLEREGRPFPSLNELSRGIDSAISGLQLAGEYHRVPAGHLARAIFRRSIADWDGATRDLDEVEEIAGPGGMRLFSRNSSAATSMRGKLLHGNTPPLRSRKKSVVIGDEKEELE
jgi:hypothetical protein